MALDAWHQRLEKHFGSVSDARKSTAWPVFALEHGLSAAEVDQLRDEIRRSAIQAHPLDRFWLPWVVYAAEEGYSYEGDEYWQSFEAHTPGWTEHGDRNWIRQRFVHFRHLFGGATPSGPWAEHFSIISWPITHAILPRDLQQQLARVLYEVRFGFTTDLLRSPELLGQRIASASYIASARFQRFAQDTHLVGHISTTLLIHDSTQERLLPSTFDRIIHDLERQQSAKEWLGSARQSARPRIEVHGLGARARSKDDNESANLPETGALAAIEPRLRVIRKDGAEWRAVIDVPDLGATAQIYPALRDALAVARCVVSGATRPLARGALLWGRQTIALRTWPSPTEALITLEGQYAELNETIRRLTRFDPRSTRLFKLDTDDTGYEVRQLSVRPGSRYILTTTDAHHAGIGKEVRTSLPGTRFFEFHVPSPWTEEEVATLERAGLVATRRVDFWPAGVPVAVWSGDGECEWLCNEPLLLGARSDFDLSSFEFVVHGSDGEEVRAQLIPPRAGQATYVRLAALSPGTVVCSLRAESIDGERADGALRVVVREPRPWSRGRRSNDLVSITTMPARPSLEELWEGRAEVEVRGATGHNAHVNVAFVDEAQQIATKRLTSIPLPIEARLWIDTFDREVRNDRRMQAAFDEARLCRISVDVENVGTATLECEREFVPLRWRFHATINTAALRLMNDSAAEQIEVFRYSFSDPLTRLSASAPDLLRGTKPPSDGGLFVAETANYYRAIVVPPTMRTLQDLSCTPTIRSAGRSVGRVMELLSAAQRWSTARIPGSGSIGAVVRQRVVLQAIADSIAAQLCGDDWVRLEHMTPIDRPTPHLIQRLIGGISLRPEHRAIGQAIARDAAWHVAAPASDRVTRFSLTMKRLLAAYWPHSAPLEDPAEFILRLVSDPGGFLGWAGTRAEAGVRALFNFSVYTRAARCLVLVVHRALPPAPIRSDHIYEGWTWTSSN